MGACTAAGRLFRSVLPGARTRLQATGKAFILAFMVDRPVQLSVFSASPLLSVKGSLRLAALLLRPAR
jgi:hypothetical protein